MDRGSELLEVGYRLVAEQDEGCKRVGLSEQGDKRASPYLALHETSVTLGGASSLLLEAFPPPSLRCLRGRSSRLLWQMGFPVAGPRLSSGTSRSCRP